MLLRSVPESLEDACSPCSLGVAFSSWNPGLSCAMPLKNSAGSKKAGLKRKQRNILRGIQLQIFSMALGNSLGNAFRLVPGPAEGIGKMPGVLPALAARDFPLENRQPHAGGGSVHPPSSDGQ